MTTTEHTTIPVLSDPRPAFGAAVDLAGTVVAGIRPDQLTDPTPCHEFDVRQLRAHLLGVLRRVSTIGRLGHVGEVPDIPTDIPADGVTEAWADAAADVIDVWAADDELLDRECVLPWAAMPGNIALRIYVNEVLVHSWDLATATGQQPAWSDDVVEVAFEAIQMGLPAEGRTESFEELRQSMPPELQDFTDPFAAAVEVSADAPLIDRLVAWNGRTP